AAVFHQSTKVLEYADYLRPMYSDEHGHCVRVNFDRMLQVDPASYEHVLRFIVSNSLQVFGFDGNEIPPFTESQEEAA
ncbi:MAG: DUF3579 domain-containing protein, partial [Acidihalobacter sp.]|uniref:DUF3579 domain-containing protein n=1 Tax=Acidihalobacter sp. TaxID=1872108 RepID=UPI00307E785D